MTETIDPTTITILVTPSSDYAAAFEGDERIAIGDLDEVTEHVLEALGVDIEWGNGDFIRSGTGDYADTLTQVRAWPAERARREAEAARVAEQEASSPMLGEVFVATVVREDGDTSAAAVATEAQALDWLFGALRMVEENVIGPMPTFEEMRRYANDRGWVIALSTPDA